MTAPRSAPDGGGQGCGGMILAALVVMFLLGLAVQSCDGTDELPYNADCDRAASALEFNGQDYDENYEACMKLDAVLED